MAGLVNIYKTPFQGGPDYTLFLIIWTHLPSVSIITLASIWHLSILPSSLVSFLLEGRQRKCDDPTHSWTCCSWCCHLIWYYQNKCKYYLQQWYFFIVCILLALHCNRKNEVWEKFLEDLGIPSYYQKLTSMDGVLRQNNHNAIRNIQTVLCRLGIYFVLLSLAPISFSSALLYVFATPSLHIIIIHPSWWRGIKPINDADLRLFSSQSITSRLKSIHALWGMLLLLKY